MFMVSQVVPFMVVNLVIVTRNEYSAVLWKMLVPTVIVAAVCNSADAGIQGKINN